MFKYLFRIIILGHPGVGKSSLLAVLTNRHMSLFHEPTIGIDFASTLTPIIEGPIDQVSSMGYSRTRIF